MKRLNNLYDNMISYRNINFVFNKLRYNCHNKKKVFEFIKYKNCNLIDILEKLRNFDYKFSNYSIFLIQEKKYRIIMSESISDKIVNQMISYFILNPVLKSLIDTNVATRKGKGTSYAYGKMKNYINKIGYYREVYVLKIDINKYFYNIDHEILFSMLERKIKDKNSLEILSEIISLTDMEYINITIKKLINDEIHRINNLNISENEKKIKIDELNSIPLYSKGKGISIGCLSNQLFAIFYLNGIDHYIKEDLKCKYYIRYMDDLYIFDYDKDRLKLYFGLIEKELGKLKLSINNKSGIYNIKNGVNFLGYTYFVENGSVKIRYNNNTIRKIDRKLRKKYNVDFNGYYKSISSYKGYFILCNTSLYNNKYKKLELKSNYDKYRLLKKRYPNFIVFVKKKNKYYTFSDDLDRVNFLIKKNYSYFNYKTFLRVKNKIKKYVILVGNSIEIYEEAN